MATITLQNKQQVVLFNTELCGQLSDGYWENSRPTDHWKVPCKAKVVIGDEASVDFYPSRAYNFANKMLLDCVGDRMLMKCRISIKFPQLSESAMDVLDSGQWWWNPKTDNADHIAHLEKVKAELKLIGIDCFADVKIVVDLLEKSKYGMKEMRKDLKVINQAFKNMK